MRVIVSGFILVGFFILPTEVLCQAAQSDTLFLSHAIRNIEDLYAQSIGVESHLYNGVLYKEYNAHTSDEGIPYFRTEDWQDGSVFYDGELYEDVPMIYDLVQEKIVIEHGYGGIKLELINEKIKYFTLSGHTFVRLVADSSRSPIRTGFYDLLYDGKAKCLAKLQKTYNEEIVSRELLIKFRENNRYFIVLNGRYYQVKGKSSILSVLEDRAADIRKFIRKNKIKFKGDRGQAIAKVVRYYDQTGN